MSERQVSTLPAASRTTPPALVPAAWPSAARCVHGSSPTPRYWIAAPARLRAALLYVLVFAFVVPGLHVSIGLSLDRLVANPLLACPREWNLLGLVPAAGGLLLALWSMACLWTEGHGLPNSALPPTWLVKGGAYRFCRHPLCLGSSLLLLGASILIRSFWCAIVSWPLFAPRRTPRRHGWLGHRERTLDTIGKSRGADSHCCSPLGPPAYPSAGTSCPRFLHGWPVHMPGTADFAGMGLAGTPGVTGTMSQIGLRSHIYQLFDGGVT